jgi:hypothetical protein
MTHTICSVGFFLYLCEMEPISVNYPDSSLSDLTNPCAEIFVDYGMSNMSVILHQTDMDKKIYEMVMNRLHAERLRHKMGGDHGVHLTIKNTEDGN